MSDNKVPIDWLVSLRKILSKKYPGSRMSGSKKMMDWVLDLYLSGLTPEQAAIKFERYWL